MNILELMEIRRAGERPSGLLDVQVGTKYPWFAEVWMRDLDQDLRPFVGLNVWASGERYTRSELARAFRDADTLIVSGSDGTDFVKWCGQSWETACNS